MNKPVAALFLCLLLSLCMVFILALASFRHMVLSADGYIIARSAAVTSSMAFVIAELALLSEKQRLLSLFCTAAAILAIYPIYLIAYWLFLPA